MSPDTAGGEAQAGSGLRSVGDWMSELFQIATKRAGHFFPMIVILIVPFSLANGVSVWLAFRNAVLITNQQTGDLRFVNDGVGAGSYWLVGLSFLGLILATCYLSLTAARQSMAAMTEAEEPWSASMRGGLSRIPRGFGVIAAVIGALFLLYVALILVVALLPPLLIIALPGYAVLSFLVATRLSLAIIGAANAPSGISALRTSWRLTQGHFWAVFGRMWLILLVSIAISLVMSIIAAPFTALAGGGGAAAFDPGAERLEFNAILGDNPAIFAIGQLFNALGTGAGAVVWVVGLTGLYRDLGGPGRDDE